jgi:hypothetical protein
MVPKVHGVLAAGAVADVVGALGLAAPEHALTTTVAKIAPPQPRTTFPIMAGRSGSCPSPYRIGTYAGDPVQSAADMRVIGAGS